MSGLDNAFSGLKSKEIKPEESEKPQEKKFEGGRSLHDTVDTPWLKKRPVKKEMDALNALSKSFNIVLGNEP